MLQRPSIDDDVFASAQHEIEAVLYKTDHPRLIDHYIDYFGEPRRR
jgi:hypothetical protein